MSDVLYIGFDSDGPTCQVCGEYQEGAREVACTSCGTLHHLDCWEFIGRCTTFGCGNKSWGEPHVGEVAVLHVRENDPVPVIPGWKAPATRGRPSASPETQMTVPQKMTVRSKAVDLTAPRVRLDLTTPLEQGTAAAGVLSMVFGSLIFSGLMSWMSLGLSAALAVLWLKTDCTYVLNNDDRTLDYRRQVFDSVEYFPVFHFDDVSLVTTKGEYSSRKNHSFWTYTPVAVLRNGEVVALTDAEHSNFAQRRHFPRAEENARAFARHIGARYLPGEEERLLQVIPTGGTVEARHRKRGLFGGYG